ncbi:MAG: TonB-dependent receptor, partial [Bacteroidales bacterium]|nr:TonB-dependent receptor [Bacteroidales bacterium]
MKRCKNQVPDRCGSFHLVSTLVLLLVSALFSQIRAQAVSENYATLKGVVLEMETNLPVEFATVQLLPQGAVTMTGSKGEFKLERVSPGRVNLKIQFLGMETIDTALTLVGGRVTELSFHMVYSSFRLNEVQVVATESKAGQATASTISRQAMDHLQTSSLSDILQLLPGGVVTNTSLSSAKTFMIRNIDKGTTASDMNSLGTAIFIDGAPVSNNSNLQALSPVITGAAGVVGGGSSPDQGFDLRSISTDNIESVEVIRGIPSVEYGDLTSGAVVVRSKAGKEPFTLRFKTDPYIYQTSVSKGMSLGENKGNLNLSGDYAYSTTERTESYIYYQRVAAKALYSNVFGDLSSNTSVDFSLGKDTRELNPNDLRSQLESGASDFGLRINTNGTWTINKGWLNNVIYTLSGTYRDKHSFRQELLGNAFSAYSMSRTDGAVLSNIPGQRVYDINGKELTNIPYEEGSYYATYLPNEYLSRYDIYGKEVNIFAKVNANFAKKTGDVFNRILVGIEFRTDGNLGKGKVYDPKNPPYRVLSSENSSPRPRKYSDIPFIEQLGIYAEENMVWTVADKRDLTIQAGARFDLIESKAILTPRINASFEIIPKMFWIRGGYGITSKAPTTLYLYPENAYFDFVHYNTLNKSGVPVAEQLMLNTTRIFDTSNPDLKIASNRKSEIGLDLKINKMRFSATAYNEKLVNGYNLGYDIENFKLIEYIQYKAAASSQPGQIPIMEEKSRDNVFISYASPMNNLRAHNRGVEFDFDLGRF